MKLRVLALLAAATLVAPAVQAHVRLQFPAPRYPRPDELPVNPGEDGQEMKYGPCGVAGDARTTDLSRITVFEPGETITVEWTETIDHPGFFRISFDDDGQDAFVPPPTSTADIQVTPVLPVLADNIADGPAGDYSQSVTLPDMECENCTLQLIQVMSDAATWSGADDTDIYFQCADIAIRASGGGTGGMGGTAGTGGATGGTAGTGGATGGTAGTGGVAGGSAGTGGATGGTAGSGGTGGMAGTGPLVTNPRTESADEGGCSVQRGNSSVLSSLALLLLGASGMLARRRRAKSRQTVGRS